MDKFGIEIIEAKLVVRTADSIGGFAVVVETPQFLGVGEAMLAAEKCLPFGVWVHLKQRTDPAVNGRERTTVWFVGLPDRVILASGSGDNRVFSYISWLNNHLSL
jgi:hypothetical protein